MWAPIIIFVITLIALVSILFYRAYEIRSGDENFSSSRRIKNKIKNYISKVVPARDIIIGFLHKYLRLFFLGILRIWVKIDITIKKKMKTIFPDRNVSIKNPFRNMIRIEKLNTRLENARKMMNEYKNKLFKMKKKFEEEEKKNSDM